MVYYQSEWQVWGKPFSVLEGNFLISLWVQCFPVDRLPVSAACWFFPTEVLVWDPWDVFWQNQATCRLRAQGQLKVTASCNVWVVEAGLVQPYALYIKGQLFILRPEISLILNFCMVGDRLMELLSGFFHSVGSY